MTEGDGTEVNDRTDGCWHYDHDRFCVQCDPASYGPCDQPCPYQHDCCRCGNLDGDACALLGHNEGSEEHCSDCGVPLTKDAGEGYDGRCGTCADRRENLPAGE